jgi:hypothetical protein
MISTFNKCTPSCEYEFESMHLESKIDFQSYPVGFFTDQNTRPKIGPASIDKYRLQVIVLYYLLGVFLSGMIIWLKGP